MTSPMELHPRCPMIAWRRFVEIVGAHQRFVLTTHIRPDGDAVGSQVALAEILESLGKDVAVCNDFAAPPNLRFLNVPPRLRKLGADISETQLADREVLIVLDTSAWAQLGAMSNVIRNTKAVKVVIDHHQSGDDLGAELFKNGNAEATGALVVEAADALGVALTPQIARPAFVALATDTGWFRFGSTTSATLRLAARLEDAGARPDELYKALYENDTHARLQVIGRTLARSQTDLDGRLITSWIEQADFAATGALPSDSEDIINMLLSVGSTQAAVILVEQPTGGFKISLRSRCPLNCSTLAAQFGGGGHKAAAGAFLDEPLESARRKILDAVVAAMRLIENP
jgi:bifunctional oligoribonuclease and PAP phosphatase NrnA